MSSGARTGDRWTAGRRDLLEKLLEEEGVERAEGDRIPRRDDPDRAPLSFGQQRLWFLHQFDPESAAYNIAPALHLEGALDLADLARALRRLVRRHDVLRTTYAVEGDEAVQLVRPDLLPRLPVVDLTVLPPGHREEERDRLAVEEGLRPFDLAHGPVLRTTLLRLGERSQDILLTLHHIASDAWSSSVMIRDLITLYLAAVEGREEPLEPLPIQYGDYAAWQRGRLSEEHLEREVAAWRDRLEGAPVLELPTDRPRPAVRTTRGASHRFCLPERLSALVKGLARSHGVSLFTVLLAAFKLFLSRVADTRDVVVGTPVAHRIRPELEDLIGFFVNTLVLRTDLGSDPTFQEVIEWVGETVAAARDHQDVPFEKLVDELAPERDLSHTPLFQVMFVFQGDPGRPSSPLPDLRLIPREREQRIVKFDLTLVMSDGPGPIEGAIEYNADLFDRATARRSAARYVRLLEAAVAAPDAPVSELPVLLPQERHQLLEEWSRPGAKHPVEASLGALFSERARQAPERTAVSCDGVHWTYGALEARTNRLARHLRACGVDVGDRVGLCFERTAELVVGILGVLKAGAAYVPLDRAHPAERLELILRDAEVAALVAESAVAGNLPEVEAPRVLLDGEAGRIAAESAAEPEWKVPPEASAYVIYTSGSTGRPKGVPVSHTNVVRLFRATESWFGFGAESVWALFHSYAFDMSVWELWGAFLYGGRLVVVPYEVSREPERFRDLLARERVTSLCQTPSAFRQLVRAEEELGASGEDLALRWVVFGGEALEVESLRPWWERHGSVRPRLVNMYGITETTVHSTYRPMSPADLQRPWSNGVGEPIPDLSVYVLDSSGRPAPTGVAGELCVGGAGVARGYVGRRGLTAERFVPDPYGGRRGARLYRSGDLGRWLATGEIEYLGRIDHQVKLRGFRIELGEIESVLAAHPGVSESVVVVRHQGAEERLVGYVVGRAGGAPGGAELRRHAARSLPEYMVPAALVELEALPLTANGKVDRRALPAPGGERPDMEAEYVAPRTRAEQELATVWSEVLGVERPGVHDNFFNLGGDSILSIRVVYGARGRGIDFGVQDLFRHPTIAGLLEQVAAGGVDRAEAASTEPFELVREDDRRRLPDGLEDAYPLARMQAGMLYHMELTPEEPPYHNVDSWHLRCPFDAELFQEAVDEVVARHPVLRTGFALEGYSEALQLVHADARLQVRFADLGELDDAEQERTIDELIERQKTSLFDLERPPLLRFFVYRRAQDRFQLTITENHAILDGWSLHSTLSDVFSDYLDRVADRNGGARSVPAVTYRDFIALERAALEDPGCRSYWDRQLTGYSFLRLPRLPEIHRTVVPERGDRIREWPVVIAPELGEAVQKLVRRTGVPLKSVLLAAHLRVLGLLGATDDVTTGLILNGRPEVAGGEEIRGLFLNTLPLRLRLGAGTWKDLVRRTFAAEREMLPYRRFPTAELKRQLGGDSLFETTFNYVHFHVVDGVLQTGEVEVLAAKSSEKTDIPLSADFKLDPSGTGVGLDLEFDAGEIDPVQMERIAGYYLAVLEEMARNPEGRIHDLDVLSRSERRQLLEEWSLPPLKELEAPHLPALFERRVAEGPDRVAVVAGEVCLSYGELDRRSGRLARRLRRMGVRTGDRVPVAMGRGVEMMEAVLGVARAGAAFVPIDPIYGVERLVTVLGEVRARLLVTRRADAEALAGGIGDAVEMLHVDELGDGPALDEETPVAEVLPDHPVYTIYTSGSTGRPKGVTVSHRNLLAAYTAWEEDYELRSRVQRHLQTASIAFDVFCGDLVRSLGSGGTLVSCPRELLLEPDRLVGLLTGRRIDAVEVVPAVARGLIRHLEARDAVVDGLRLFVVGSDAWHTDELSRLATHLGPDTRLVSSYGVTEATIDSTRFEAAAERVPAESPVPIGRPFAGTRTYVLGGGLDPVPVSVSGELCIAGETVSQGYTGQGAATAERFVPDPASTDPGGRLYRTGDLARYFPDGNLELLGRLDDQVKLRGFRVEPGEIEAVLAEHPRVEQAVVLALPEPVGDGLRLGAYVVAHDGEPRSDDLRGFVNDRLPSYMVPALVLFLDEMPLTANGKVDRGALPEPDSVTTEEGRYEAPETEAERTVARIWEEVLGRQRVGRDDDFFDLGGHSLLATQVISRVRDRLEVSVPLRKVFEEPRLARFAEVVERREAEGDAGSATIQRVSRELDGRTDPAVDADALSEAEVDSLLEELMEDRGAPP